MALVTIQRSPSPNVQPDLDAVDSCDDAGEGRTQMRKSLSESYFTVKGAALILPHTQCTKKLSKKSHGGEIQHHLQAMLHLLRPADTIKIAVRLENINQYQRYMALVSTKGRQDTEEAVVLGIDCSGTEASVGLALPVCMGLQIKLGGDGGFSLCTDGQSYLFKPISVQAMWSAIQSLVKVQHIAEDARYMHDGLSHTWVGYYRSCIDRRDSARVSQWNVEGVEVFAPSSLSVKANDSDSETLKMIISQTLKEVMMTVDLDEATSVMLRTAVEEKMTMPLIEFKSYFDEEVIRILGQMDEPSEILDFLYLGSEWNASNLEELTQKGIGYILNVTKEIDNFFEGKFHYYNIRLTDQEDSDLLKHWDKTYKFISKARSQNSKVLVHCKMGVSRSAATVMAFVMKDRRLTVDEAFQFVKERRSCVHPNSGFMEQLQTYEGILTASNKRDIFRCKSDQNLLDEGPTEETEPIKDSFLGDSLFHTMSHSDWLSASGGVAPGEEWIDSLDGDQALGSDFLQMDTDLEIESRSADSMEESLPDLPSPPPYSTASSCEAQMAPKLTVNTGPVFSVPILDVHAASPKLDSPLEKKSCTGTDASAGACCGQLQTPPGVLGSRIKPDSSWIRLDLEEFNEGSQETDDGLLPDNSIGHTHSSFSNPETNKEAVTDQSDSKLVPAASLTVAGSLPYNSCQILHNNSPSTPDNPPDCQIKTCAQFYIGSKHISQDKSSPTKTISSPDVYNNPASISSFLFDSTKRKPGKLTTADDCQIPTSNLSPDSANQELVDQIMQHTYSAHHQKGWQSEASAATNNSRVAQVCGGANYNESNNIESSTDRNKLDVHCPFIQEKDIGDPGKEQSLQQASEKVGFTVGDQFDEDDKHIQISECQPATESPQPGTKSPQPATESPQPCTKSPQPATESPQPGTKSPQPATESPQPGTKSPQPAIESLQPGTQSPQPATESPQPTTESPQPATESPKPPTESPQLHNFANLSLHSQPVSEPPYKFSNDKDGQEIIGSTPLVLKASALKDCRDYQSSQGLTSSLPLMGISLDNLQTLSDDGVKLLEQRSSAMTFPQGTKNMDVDCDQAPETKPESDEKTTRVLSRLDFTSSLHKVDGQTGNSAIDSSLDHETESAKVERHTLEDFDKSKPFDLDGSNSEQRTMGNFSSVTLALIREIGSALQISPANPLKTEDVTVEEPCSNQVKFLVRKIERQAKTADSTKSPTLSGGSRKMAFQSKDKPAKPRSSSANDANFESRSDVVKTPWSTKTSGFPSPLDYQCQSTVMLDFHDSSVIQKKDNTTRCGISRSCSDGDRIIQKHPVIQKIDIRPNVPPSYLPVNEASEEVKGNKSSKSEAVISPGATDYPIGCDPIEPSVVKHLVGKFETSTSPSLDKSPTELSPQHIPRLNDGQDFSLIHLPAHRGNSPVDKESHAPVASHPISPSASQLLLKPTCSPLLPSPSSLNSPAASVIAFSMKSSLTEDTTTHNKLSSNKSSSSENTLNSGSLKFTDSFSEESSGKSDRLKFIDRQACSTKFSETGSSGDSTLRRSSLTDEQSDSSKLDVALKRASNEGRKIQVLQGRTQPDSDSQQQQPREGHFDSLA